MIDTLKPLIKQFLPYAKEKMGFERPPSLFLKQDASNASNPLGKTAFYDPSGMSITLYVTDRHPKDVMRSLSHELVHHTQNCNGQLDNPGEMGEGYAQNNEHMREMERQAYEMGNMCFRDWEDSIKGTIYNESLQKGVKENMSTKNWKDKELNTLLLEKWGFKFDLDGLTEGKADDWGKNPAAFTGKEEEEEEEEKDVKTGKALEEESDLEEAFEKPKSATGSGPTNKGGKTDRSDVANKDTSKFGQGGSKGGGKESAGGTNAPPQAGKMDRTDVANKASGRWLKEDVELHVYVEAMTKCKQQHTIAGDSIVRECIEEEMTRIMNEGFGEGKPANDEWSKKRQIYMEEDEEELDERHKPDNVRQGREPGRRKKNIKTGQRTVDEAHLPAATQAGTSLEGISLDALQQCKGLLAGGGLAGWEDFIECVQSEPVAATEPMGAVSGRQRGGPIGPNIGAGAMTQEQKRRIVKKILQNFKESKR